MPLLISVLCIYMPPSTFSPVGGDDRVQQWPYMYRVYIHVDLVHTFNITQKSKIPGRGGGVSVPEFTKLCILPCLYIACCAELELLTQYCQCAGQFYIQLSSDEKWVRRSIPLSTSTDTDDRTIYVVCSYCTFVSPPRTLLRALKQTRSLLEW